MAQEQMQVEGETSHTMIVRGGTVTNCEPRSARAAASRPRARRRTLTARPPLPRPHAPQAELEKLGIKAKTVEVLSKAGYYTVESVVYTPRRTLVRARTPRRHHRRRRALPATRD
jgi:hypothetical protein